ncbi:MAG: FAD-binding oxidoreductase [Gammaproteobacteria bacterium]|nr:FAD-binding oxidoreductase [Gammaproteobacteria bacterium]
MSRIENKIIQELKSKIRGQVISPTEPDYNKARTIWNAMINKKPGVIVRCSGVADVITSVNIARDSNLLLAVHGAGHNIAGNSVCDGGIMIDLSQMNSVRIDPKSKKAYVEPGAILGDFDHEAQAFGLATPLGINSTTGVSGLTLGGGFGWLTRKHGMTIDNLISADVITADGELVHTNENQKPDLFWAIRGGGGNFGIVTLFEFQLHKVGPDVLAGLMVFPFKDAKSVLKKYRKFVQKIPNELNVWVILRQAPPLPFLPKRVHGKEVVILAILYSGEIKQGQKLIKPLRRFAKAHGEHTGAMPYEAWQQGFDPLLTPGARNYWKSHNFSELSDGALDAIIEYAGKLPSPQCEIFIGLLGGKAAKVSPDAMAYGNRDANFILNVHSRWDKAKDDTKCISWARDFFDASAPYATGGVYINFVTQDETDRIAAAYGKNYNKLVRIKNKYDPNNLFRVNHNIKPTV